MSTTYKRIAAADKTVEILEFLADQRGPVSGSVISKALNLPYNTLMCYLATLCDKQFIRQIGDSYELGPKISMMWARYRAKLQSKIGQLTQEFNELEACNG